MEISDNVAVMCVPFDKIISVIRRAYPKPEMYGGDAGGNTPAILRALRDDALIAQIARGIWDAEIKMEVELKKVKHADEIREGAQRAYNSAIDELVRIAAGKS